MAVQCTQEMLDNERMRRECWDEGTQPDPPQGGSSLPLPESQETEKEKNGENAAIAPSTTPSSSTKIVVRVTLPDGRPNGATTSPPPSAGGPNPGSAAEGTAGAGDAEVAAAAAAAAPVAPARVPDPRAPALPGTIRAQLRPQQETVALLAEPRAKTTVRSTLTANTLSDKQHRGLRPVLIR